MACFRCGVWITASLFLVYVTLVVQSADPNVVQVPEVDGVKLVCPSSIPNDTQVNWKGPDGAQLNFENRTFADTRLSFVDDRDLQIANAVPNDNGIYTCVAGSQEETVTLTVYATDSTKVMVSFEGQYFDSTTGQEQIRTDMNASQQVTCMVKGAFPMPELSFEIIDHNGTTYSMIPMGDVSIQSNQESDKTYSVNATTVVEITSALFNNRKINCITKFSINGQEESFMTSAYFYINKVTPTIFVYSGFRTLNPNDNTAKYTCHGERGRPEIDAITFYIDGEVFAEPYNFMITPVVCVLLTDRDQYYYNMYACNSSIEVYGITKMDNGKLLDCDFTYQNQTVGGFAGSSQMIDFRFPPTMVNVTGNMPIEVSDFTSVSLTLTCMTDSSKSAATLTWYNGSSVIANTQPMNSTPGLYEGVETSQMLTLSVDRYMDGNVIQCRASHFYLSSELSASVVLNVSYSPEIIQPSMAIYRVYSEEKISIPCSVLAKPAAEIKWMKVHSDTNKTEVTSVRMSDSNILLKFDYVTTMNAGKYECQATNSIMPSDSKMIELIVLDKNELESYHITKLTPSPNSIMLEFDKPTDRQIQSLFLQHEKLNTNGEPAFQRETEIIIPAAANTISITLADLQPDTSYTLRLREVDAKYGLVATIYLDTVRTSESDDDNEYSRSDLNVAIIVSVLVTAAVVAIICIIIFVAIKKCGCCTSSSTRYEMQMKPRA